MRQSQGSPQNSQSEIEHQRFRKSKKIQNSLMNAIATQTKSQKSSLEQTHQQLLEYQSQLRMLHSEHLTLEMCVVYLYEWRKHRFLVENIFKRLVQLINYNTIHIIIQIFSLQQQAKLQQQYTQLCQGLINDKFQLYLLVRWAYQTFWPTDQQKLVFSLGRLDSLLLKKINYYQETLSEEEQMQRIQQKKRLADYIPYANKFYSRLFKIPQLLKDKDKDKRDQSLHAYLIGKLTFGEQAHIVLPLQDPQGSTLAVRIVQEHSHTFSTKDRVPFKIVFQTVNRHDFRSYLKMKCLIKAQSSSKTDEGYTQLKTNGQKKHQQKKEIENGKSEQNEQSEENDQCFVLEKSYFGELWKATKQNIKQSSPYSDLPSYKLKTFIVKSGDDLRQQYMAMQLIIMLQKIFKQENLKLWIKPYEVIPYNANKGLIGFVNDTRTISYLKQKSGQKSLVSIYKQIFGMNWQASLTNFTQSLAGYSLMQYLFNIKDRHNNNILVDTVGHLVHIDFSFIISSTPGNMNFQRAPFKLTADYIELMEGFDSDIFYYFRVLFFLGLKYVRKYQKEIMQIIAVMRNCHNMKCFQYFDEDKMLKRFHQNATDQELKAIVQGLCKDAYTSYTTTNYDRYQWYTNFIYS